MRRQAQQLVKRFLKFQKLLPAAENKLAGLLQLLDRTPAQERLALVAKMQEELRALAASRSGLLSARISMCVAGAGTQCWHYVFINSGEQGACARG